jgi:hypothetical protein
VQYEPSCYPLRCRVTIGRTGEEAGLDTWRDTGRSEPSPTIPRTPTPMTAGIGRAYEWFLQLPVVIVLTVLWVAGAALLGSCALVLYMAGSVVVRSLAGSI